MTPSETPIRTLFSAPMVSMLGALVLLASLVTACQREPTPAEIDLSRLQGHWEGHGPGGECTVTISGNTLRFYARPDFWYETTFTLRPGTDPRQLHATITKDSSSEPTHIGTLVVALFTVKDEALTFGVVEDFDGPPPTDLVGDWDRVMDIFEFERAQP